MKVTIAEIAAQFDALIEGRVSREAIAAWAESVRQAGHSNTLTYDPVSNEETIWNAITYLTGVDLKTEPAVYLHSLDILFGHAMSPHPSGGWNRSERGLSGSILVMLCVSRRMAVSLKRPAIILSGW